MFLYPNPTRDNSEIAFRNVAMILKDKGIEHRVIRVIDVVRYVQRFRDRMGGLIKAMSSPEYHILKEYQRATELPDDWKRIVGFRSESGSEMAESMIIVPAESLRSIDFGNILHAAYCGCEGCQTRF